MAPTKKEPEQWVDGGCFSTIRGKRRNIVVETSDGRKVADVVEADDAALILATQDMREALGRLVSIHTQNNTGPDAEAQFRQVAIEARAVLAKARGGA